MAEPKALLESPCAWCNYNGPNYWQPGTHAQWCPWFEVGGEEARRGWLRVMAIGDGRQRRHEYEEWQRAEAEEAERLRKKPADTVSAPGKDGR